MLKSEQFLKEAFAGESQANRTYLAFAQKADQEGYPQAARLFRAAAAAETVHAHTHLRAWGGIGSTADNLKQAVAGETHEFTEMYPEMIAAAQAEGNKTAERSFSYAIAAEKIHAAMYQSMADQLGQDKVEEYPYYVCPVCGHTVERGAPDVCPVCGAKGDKFMKID